MNVFVKSQMLHILKETLSKIKGLKAAPNHRQWIQTCFLYVNMVSLNYYETAISII